MRFEWVHMKDVEFINGTAAHEFSLMIHYEDGKSCFLGSPLWLGHGLIFIVKAEEDEL